MEFKNSCDGSICTHFGKCIAFYGPYRRSVYKYILYNITLCRLNLIGLAVAFFDNGLPRRGDGSALTLNICRDLIILQGNVHRFDIKLIQLRPISVPCCNDKLSWSCRKHFKFKGFGMSRICSIAGSCNL